MISRSRAASLVAVLAVAACSEPTIPSPIGYSGAGAISNLVGAKTYILNSKTDALPANLAASVASAGGTLTAALNGAGVAIAESTDPNFAAKARKIAGIAEVGEDAVMQFTKPNPVTDEFTAEESDVIVEAGFGGNETFRNVQWAPDAVSAPAAWDAGNLGLGARVAILDGGIRNTHIDIAPNLDVAHSTSFVPGFAYNTDVGTFWHGTHVAGIVAAPGQGIGTVGIAPSATIIGVKVLHNGSGAFSWIAQGIFYAATPIAEGGAGAHIINMSLGAYLSKGGADVAHFLGALSKVTKYARARGVFVVAAAGNEAVDLDHADSVFIPAQNVGAVAVSATGPLGFGVGATNFDRPASYTNFGQSAIEFAGPGGDGVYAGGGSCSKALIPAGTISGPCALFDLVMAPCRGSGGSNTSYCFAAGTSMAAPAVSGVAALVVGKYGPMPAAQLEAILRNSADDLGKPGNDDFYGKGRVNAFRATQ